MKTIISSGIRILFFVMLTIVLGVCLFANNISYSTLKSAIRYEPAIMGVGVLGILLLFCLCKKYDGVEAKKKKYIIWLLSIMF